MRRFCDVHSAIAQFYITEVDAHRKRTSGAFIHPKWEENIFKEQSRTAWTILSFTVSACLGEARHAYRPCGSFRVANGDESDYRWKAIYEIIYRALAVKPTNDLGSHGYRALLFKVSMPMHLWLKTLEALVYIFGGLLWKEGGFGGERWAEICRAGIGCYKATLGDDLTELTLKTDRLVNLCHNGGIFLNKFECGNIGACPSKLNPDSHIISGVERVNIETVLAWHSNGPENMLRAMAEAPLCRRGPRELCDPNMKIHTEEMERTDEIEKILEGKKVKAKDPSYQRLTEELDNPPSHDDDDESDEGEEDGDDLLEGLGDDPVQV